MTAVISRWSKGHPDKSTSEPEALTRADVEQMLTAYEDENLIASLGEAWVHHYRQRAALCRLALVGVDAQERAALVHLLGSSTCDAPGVRSYDAFAVTCPECLADEAMRNAETHQRDAAEAKFNRMREEIMEAVMAKNGEKLAEACAEEVKAPYWVLRLGDLHRGKIRGRAPDDRKWWTAERRQFRRFRTLIGAARAADSDERIVCVGRHAAKGDPTPGALKQQLAGAGRALGKAMGELTECRRTIEDQNAALSTANHTATLLQREVDRLRMESDETPSVIAKLEGEVAALTEALDRARGDVAGLTKRTREAEAKLQEMASYCAQLHSAQSAYVETRKAEIQELQLTVERLLELPSTLETS